MIVQEGDDNWIYDRMKGIGASDVPGILGTCDFKTPESVLKSKIVFEKFEGNFATQRGHLLEPIAVDMFCRPRLLTYKKERMAYSKWKTLVSSFDGLTDEHIIEAKAPALWKHTLALCGIVPDTYKDQLQAQLLCGQKKSNFYVSFHPDLPEDFQLAVIEVFPDRKRQAEILWECRRFWRRVIQAKKDLSLEKPDLPSSSP